MHRLRTLGAVALDVDVAEASNTPTLRRRLALLVLLSGAAPAGLPRDRVIAWLWPESDTTRARNALNQALFALRRQLGADAITLTGGELRVDPDRVRIDRLEFEQALDSGQYQLAVSIYGGPFLDGFSITDAPEFDRWGDEERDRLARRYVAALESLATDAERAADFGRAADWWRRMLATDPHNARTASKLMKALAAAGDVPAALKVEAMYAARVRQDLGVEPDPALRALGKSLSEAPAADGEPPSPRNGGVPAFSPARDGVPPSGSPATRPKPSWRSRAMLGVSIAMIVGLGAFAMYGLERRNGTPARVVVAPLANETGDSTLARLGEIAADWITVGLARAGLVDVIDSRTVTNWSMNAAESRDAGGARQRAAALARAMGAGTIVWGTMYRVGDSVSFHVRIDGGDSDRASRPLDVVSAPVATPMDAVEKLRQLVLGVFAATSDPRLAAWATPSGRPPLYGAYLEYVKGLEWGSRFRWDSAAPHFQRAVELDSNFTEALLWLAQGRNENRQRQLADSLAQRLMRRRESLGAYDQAVLDNLSAQLRLDIEGALVAARRMAQLAPASQDANHAHGWAAVATNRFAEAVAAFDRIDLDRGWMRDWPFFVRWPATARHFLDDFEGELAFARRQRERFPRSDDVCAYELRALAALGRFESLGDRVEECQRYVSPEFATGVPGMYLFVAGELEAHGYDAEARTYRERNLAWYRGRLGQMPDDPLVRAGYPDALLLAGHGREARDLITAEHPDSATRPVHVRQILAGIEVSLGDSTPARALVAALAADTSTRGATVRAMARARLLARLGARAEAVDALRSAIAHGIVPAFVFHTDGALHSLRKFPPYEELVRPRE